MIKENRVIAFIPARGGSKGIPRKNIISFCGKPLIEYSIRAALGSKYVDYVMVSTEDEEIANIARDCGAKVPFLRPVELANDFSPTIDCVVHAIEKLCDMGIRFDIIVLLQPTQPLRTPEDIDGAIDVFWQNGKEAVASVVEVDESPILIRSISTNNRLIPLLNRNSTIRRQDMPRYYKIDGNIYVNSVDKLSAETSFNDNNVPYILDKKCSRDIDTLFDLTIAEYLYKNKMGDN